MNKQRVIGALSWLILLSLTACSIVLAFNIYTMPTPTYPKYPALERLSETAEQVTRLNALLNNTVPKVDDLIDLLQMEETQ